jgi:predicted DsbA family dithiol-disulfide isomerase
VREYALEKRVIHFPLHPGLPAEGVPLRQLLRGYDLDAAHARLASLMQAEGVDYRPATHAWNTRLAQELACWAQERGTPLDVPLFRAVHVEGRNVGDPEILVEIAAAAGLPADEARAVVTEGRYRARVDQDWSFARQVGVTGVPTYAIGGMGVVGAQPYEVLEQLAQRAGVPRRD